MKHLYPLWACLFIFILSPSISVTAQTIDFEYTADAGRGMSGTMSADGQHNGKNYYMLASGGNSYSLYWDDTDRWALQFVAGSVGLVATSTLDVGVNPPDFASGSWMNSSSMYNLVKLEGSGTVAAPPAMSIEVKIDKNVTCNGEADGQVTGTVSNGTGPYEVAYAYEGVVAEEGTVSTDIITETGLLAGNYSVTVTDATSAEATTTFIIKQPQVLTVKPLRKDDVACFGGSDGVASAEGEGGTSPYTYKWSNGETTPTITGLTKGTYTLTVTDANECTATRNFTVREPLKALAISTTVTAVTCHGGADGSATVTANDGTAPYTYSWSNESTEATTTGLMAGSYTVTVTDANGCTKMKDVEITEPTDKLSATATLINHVTCNGGSDGSAKVEYQGGTPPYTVLWSNNATTETITDATAGMAMVTVTDANGCSATAAVTINQPAALSAQVWLTNNASCSGKADGEAFVDGSGGTGDYTYLWSNGATTLTLSDVAADTYTVTVTDEVGCTATNSVTITEPETITIDTKVDAQVMCHGALTGEASVTAEGGTEGYTYEWSNGATTAMITGVAAGEYMVTVTDINACFASAEVTITEPTALTADLVATPDYGMGDGSAAVTITGGTGDYTYTWNSDPEQTTAIATDLFAGTYTVTVTDANACTLVDSLEVVLAGDTCATAMLIDTLLGGELDVIQYSRSFSNEAYGMDTFTNEELIAYFGNDTLYHPIYYRFTGDGSIYHIRTDNCDQDGALVDTRAALFAGACSLDSMIRRSDNYTESDSMPLIEVHTEIGEEYTLVIDGADTTLGNFCLSVMQVATVPTQEIIPVTISVYPNPTSSTIRIDQLNVREVSVFDGYGRRAAHFDNTDNEMDLTGLPSGIYYLRITDRDNRLYVSRVVKQ